MVAVEFPLARPSGVHGSSGAVTGGFARRAQPPATICEPSRVQEAGFQRLHPGADSSRRSQPNPDAKKFIAPGRGAAARDRKPKRDYDYDYD